MPEFRRWKARPWDEMNARPWILGTKKRAAGEPRPPAVFPCLRGSVLPTTPGGVCHACTSRPRPYGCAPKPGRGRLKPLFGAAPWRAAVSRSTITCSASSFQLPAPRFPLPAPRFPLPASSFQLPASSFQLPASSVQLPAFSSSCRGAALRRRGTSRTRPRCAFRCREAHRRWPAP